jgi:hypothetical protein
VFDGDVVIESAIGSDTHAQQQNTPAIDWSMAIAGDDGLVYLMRATSPVTVYASSSAGEVVHQIVVRAPSGKASPPYDFGIELLRLD